MVAERSLKPHSLARAEVHVWYSCVDMIGDAALAQYPSLLSRNEIARRNRYRFAKDRRLFLVSHALLRLGLSGYVDVTPTRWTFVQNGYGKPEIAEPRTEPPLRFNLSHTRGMAALAVTLGREIGVDVENCRRNIDSVGLSGRYFSPREAAELRSLPPERRQSRFFDFWTLKEAYIKARGMGLSFPLRDCSMRVDRKPVEIEFAAGVDDVAGEWQFEQFHPSEHHKIAVAVRRDPGTQLQIVCRATAPGTADPSASGQF